MEVGRGRNGRVTQLFFVSVVPFAAAMAWNGRPPIAAASRSANKLDIPCPGRVNIAPATSFLIMHTQPTPYLLCS
jgi:hypothetical protein